jgi:hypothetical protein
MKIPYCLVLAASAGAALLATAPAMAKHGVIITLPDRRVAVLSEGDLEGASIGSYSVAVFKDRSLINFEAGAVFSRDGSIFENNGRPRVKFADIAGDGTQELIVSKLTAGSGNYLEVDALRIDPHGVSLLVRIKTDTKHDEVAELKAACQRRSCTVRR